MTNSAKVRRAAAIICILLIPMTMSAQKKLFTLEDLNFGGTNYRNMIPADMFLTWWGDTLVRQDAEECRSVDVQTGEEHTLFTLDDVNRHTGGGTIVSAMDALFPYPGEPLVLLTSSSQRVLYDFAMGAVVWRQACEGEEHADWCSAARACAYVRDRQLVVTDSGGRCRQLTTDGSPDIVYGQAVHREEFGITKGTFWSPDGSALAFYRMDQSVVTAYPQVNTFSRVAEHEPDKYPMAGMTSHTVTIGVYDMQTERTVWLQTGDPTDRYFTNITWSPDSKYIYLQELNREQNDMWLTEYDAATGAKTRTLYEEIAEKYVEPLTPITFLPWDAGCFVLQSQRDGYNHLYVFDMGKEGPGDTCMTAFGTTYIENVGVCQLTSGSFVIKDIAGIDRARRRLIIVSNELSPMQENIWLVDVGSGERILADNGEGVHSTVPSPSGAMLCDRYSTPEIPRIIAVTDNRTGESNVILHAADPWADYETPLFSRGTIKAADGVTDLYYRMVRPPHFDASSRYPTVVYVYGGPHSHLVDDSWHYGSRSWETYMAQKGYIVFVLDNRGSDNRGLAFEQVTFRHLGQEETRDQMAGVAFLRSLPYVDTLRLGIHGWSYGGFMTISLMTAYPGVFKAGVAGGPVTDWKWYEVMYGERYMDTPESNPEGYAQTSLIGKAARLKDKLQIIIGMNDNTVVPQHALQFINACTEAGTQPDFFVYPGEGHNMAGHKSVHLHERITQYFEDYLKPAGSAQDEVE